MSSLLVANQISLFFGQKVILENVSFDLKFGEIVAIVGNNGSGKSSLLNLINRQNELDSGNFQYKKEIKVAYLTQEFDLKEDLSILENIQISLEKNFLADLYKFSDLEKKEFFIQKQQEIKLILQSLGFWVDFDDKKAVKNLSGGEKRKINLGQVLVQKADLLILDEPTNHLDILTISALEKILKEYIKTKQKTILLVSHDRYFLDKLSDRMLEIFDTKVYVHNGNYQTYLQNKKIRQNIAKITDYRKQGFLKKELEWVRAGVKARSTKDKGRLDRFFDLKSEKKFEKEQQIEIPLPKNPPLGNKIINFENLSLEFANKKVITDFNFNFSPKTVLGLIGGNATGKTTFIKAILNQTLIISGKIVVGANTIFNYQDQQKWNINPENSVFQELAFGQESMDFGDKKINSRTYLRKLGFDNQQILIPIKNLSGGQKTRLILAKILKQSGNCLILDEPTNDLDLQTIELLEKSITNFEGVCLVASHDRYFLNQVCNHILAFEGNGKFVLSTGNYDDYLGKKDLNFENLEIKIEDPNNKVKLSNKAKKLKDKQLKNLEKEIEKLEFFINNLENEFKDPNLYLKDPAKYNKKIEILSQKKENLNKLLEEWENFAI
jgi:ABC transport system ATP-binding/permease protein